MYKFFLFCFCFRFCVVTFTFSFSYKPQTLRTSKVISEKPLRRAEKKLTKLTYGTEVNHIGARAILSKLHQFSFHGV